MTTAEMTEKLSKIETGSKLTSNGKTYEVKAIICRKPGKFCVTIIEVLEVGLPETYQEAQRWGEGAGRMLTFYNTKTWDLRAQKPYMNWDFA